MYLSFLVSHLRLFKILHCFLVSQINVERNVLFLLKCNLQSETSFLALGLGQSGCLYLLTEAKRV